ncbi:replication factor C large subunit [Methanothermobacter tenebrarum]|uniref:Replication factor C large subunit n=1 Tax=Methanothermobacter tenebrarum TaxID=680118 RepID=A0A328PAV9_9EURY|nr:replication factor C large subunit [Methanothermobacter tenebrarum]NPV64528.1 replication factor C large subunit [Methanobacteriaceae archaeon]RAO78760.1 replication factor C large subunit [Methanothermobacter tenebrarum]
MAWTEKYRPKTFNEMVGNKKAIEEIKEWIKEWKDGKPQPPLLLLGPPGTGKTTLAHIIGSHFSDTLELNASDKRSYDTLIDIIGEASTTRSLFNDNLKLIILDEVDGIHGNEDRGGVRAINKIIKESKHPIVLTANDPYSKKLQTIKPACKIINIRKAHPNSIVAYLKRICEEESIEADPKILRELAKRSHGDLRSAINDLEAMAKGEKRIGAEILEAGEKDVFPGLFDAIRAILKSKNIRHIKEAMQIDEDPQLLLEFTAENIPREYEKPHEIKKAYNHLSRADIFFGRATQTRDYIYWRYASEHIGVGVALSKDETYKKFTRYAGPGSFQLLGRTRTKRQIIENLAEKISKKLHISKKVAITTLPYLKIILEDEKTAQEIRKYLELTDEEYKILKGKRKQRKSRKAKPKKMKKEDPPHQGKQTTLLQFK